MAHYDKRAENFSASRVIQIPKAEKLEKYTVTPKFCMYLFYRSQPKVLSRPITQNFERD